MIHRAGMFIGVLVVLHAVAARSNAEENVPPAGFTALFDGQDLAGWHGLGHFDPRRLAAMSEAERAEKRRAADMLDLGKHWKVESGEVVNDGSGVYLTTDKDYGDIELLVDVKILSKGESGISLRGTPLAYSDSSESGRRMAEWLDRWPAKRPGYNPGAPAKRPTIVIFAGGGAIAVDDKPFGEWNRFRIVQVGARTTVTLNDKLVVDGAPLENFWDRKAPLFAKGPLQLQTHGAEIRWRNIFVREIPADEANQRLGKAGDSGFETIFNGKDFSGWEGSVDNYEVVDGAIRCRPGKGGNIFTTAEYADFMVRLEFKLPPGGNNGLAIRYPGTGQPSIAAMCELQVLDDDAPKYAKLDPRQFNGSIYGMVPAARGYLRPVGEWNFQEVTVQGSTIKVELNGTVIVDADVSKVTEFKDNTVHPGKDLKRGHFGFAGHSDPVEFRNIRVKPL